MSSHCQSSDPSHPSSVPLSATALILGDFQNYVVDQLVPILGDLTPLLSRLASLITACRHQSIPVIHIRTAFRSAFPEQALSNKSFARMKGVNVVPEGSATADFNPSLLPQPTDVVVTKRRVSGFHSTDLDLVLRAMGVRHLIVAGVITSGVVLSTVRAGADLDYVLTVVRDGCVDRDEGLHDILMDKVFPRQATVQTTAEVLRRLHAATGVSTPMK